VGRLQQAESVVLDVAGDGDVLGEFPHLEESLAGGDFLDFRLPAGCRPVHDGVELLAVGEIDGQFEEKPVELGLGEWVGPLHLDGILGGEDEKWLLEFVSLVRDGDAVFLHRLQHRRLGLGCRPVDLVGEDDVREDRSPFELEVFVLPALGLDDDRSADDVGRHQVRCELNAGKLQAQDVGEGADEHRLAEARHALQQDVAPGEQGDDAAVDDLAVADDHLADLPADSVTVVGEGLDLLADLFGVRLVGGCLRRCVGCHTWVPASVSLSV
jgi:hypothetical protein